MRSGSPWPARRIPFIREADPADEMLPPPRRLEATCPRCGERVYEDRVYCEVCRYLPEGDP